MTKASAAAAASQTTLQGSTHCKGSDDASSTCCCSSSFSSSTQPLHHHHDEDSVEESFVDIIDMIGESYGHYLPNMQMSPMSDDSDEDALGLPLTTFNGTFMDRSACSDVHDDPRASNNISALGLIEKEEEEGGTEEHPSLLDNFKKNIDNLQNQTESLTRTIANKATRTSPQQPQQMPTEFDNVSMGDLSSMGSLSARARHQRTRASPLPASPPKKIQEEQPPKWPRATTTTTTMTDFVQARVETFRTNIDALQTQAERWSRRSTFSKNVSSLAVGLEGGVDAAQSQALIWSRRSTFSKNVALASQVFPQNIGVAQTQAEALANSVGSLLSVVQCKPPVVSSHRGISAH